MISSLPEEKRKGIPRIGEIRKKNSDNICEGKIMAILKGSVPAPVPAHRQAGTVVDNHNQSENRSHIIRTSMTHIEAVEVDHKSRVYYRKEKD
ncbi:hypothetical protein Tco_1284226 [Tanacetum coccineum]